MSAASDAAARRRMAAINQGPGDEADRRASEAIAAARGTPPRPQQWGAVRNPQGGWQAPSAIRAQPTPAEISLYRQFNIANLGGTMGGGSNSGGSLPRYTGSSSGGSSGGGRFSFGGGGGGGGGAPAPKLTQAQLDWLTTLLGGAAPKNQVATNLALPAYKGMAMRAFDPSMFNTARSALNQGVTTDIGTARQATSDMLKFLTSNYSNAFNNPNNTYATAGTTPGMQPQDMSALMQGQGVNPSAYAPTYNEGVQADQAFGNLWRVLAGNEDIAQRGRLANAQQYGTQAQQGITAAGRAGTLGINLGQGQAQSAWQQAADQRSYQDYQMQQQLAQQQALANWNRANQVSDTNTTNMNAYHNAELSSLLGLLPQFIQNPSLTLPTLQKLGLAA